MRSILACLTALVKCKVPLVRQDDYLEELNSLNSFNDLNSCSSVVRAFCLVIRKLQVVHVCKRSHITS